MARAVLVQKDIPDHLLDDFVSSGEIGVDCEMMGLNPYRDRLCLVQVATRSGPCLLIQIDEAAGAPNLKKLLEHDSVLTIFHYARMDYLFLHYRLGIQTKNIFCTKLASKIARTYTERHGLRELVREFAGEIIDKTNQTSDWGSPNLTKDQLQYAEGDVIYLFTIKEKLTEMLVREKRIDLAERLFRYIPTRVELDLLGYGDIFAH